MSTLELHAIRKTFDQTPVIHGVDLHVEHGEFIVFVGPSGCGKSTLLRLIAGLDEPTDGLLRIDGEQVNHLGAADRGCAMVFQSYALYPHMTVYANMAFGLENAKVPNKEIEQKVQEAAVMLRLEHLLDRRPTQLSGGQRQRVAIGRAIVRNPKIFLFDEPLSNLDAELRVSMRSELRELHRRLGVTMIYVTHDQVEAMTMADRIVVLRAGRVEQVGTPESLYQKPCNVFVAGFIGSPRMNLFSYRVTSGCPSLSALLPAGIHQVGVRPEHWIPADASDGLAMTVLSSEYLGAQRLVVAELEDKTRVELLVDAGLQMPIRELVHLKAHPDHIHAFDDQGQRINSETK
ncbi:ABC transporter ATP-binding protein [Limnohabitans sp. MORI2]|uniref:ABC transporter ATP-binding protein n=1 Tax=Limnohabitans sp. MORI2 TaxID=1751150 RepID=UPI0023775E32|nr:ABC transporter ATP-binding protein [Limnohabitans sp. MORI2]BDU58646.1 ABC transporter ATP-binding protein [Limnohabitans sp. MORI2]